MTTSEYNQCVRELADGLYRFACKSMSDQEEAKDVVQQAFVILWEKRDTVAAEKGKSFLFTIVYRRCMDIHRTRGRTSSTDNLKEHIATEQPRPHDLKQILQKSIIHPDTQSKNLVLLKDYEGYSYEEIATLTDLNTTQVKVYLHRARKELRQYLVSREHII